MTDTPRILIVEDDPLTALMLSGMVEERGWQVCGVASTAPRGVALADHLRPDAVLLDLKLGRGTDGIAAAREMRDELRLRIVVVSGSAPEAIGLDPGLVDLPWVAKPFRPHDVMAALDAVLANREPRPMGPPIRPRRELTLGVIGA